MDVRKKFVNYEPSIITFYNQDRDVLLKEQSLIALSTESNTVMALGNEAENLIGNNAAAVGSPLKNGVVADFELASQLFKYFLVISNGRKRLVKPKIAVCVPVDITQVEQQVFRELIASIGGKDVLIIEEPFVKAVQAIPGAYKIIIEIIPEIKTAD